MTEHTTASDQIAALISRHRFRYRDETQLQAGIAQVLAEGGVTAVAEAQLSACDRIDFLAGAVGIEVKVAGSRANVTRQLRRYAASARVEALILVTNRARHRAMPAEIAGKPVRVVWLSGVTG
jgi:hypothetical protein